MAVLVRCEAAPGTGELRGAVGPAQLRHLDARADRIACAGPLHENGEDAAPTARLRALRGADPEAARRGGSTPHRLGPPRRVRRGALRGALGRPAGLRGLALGRLRGRADRMMGGSATAEPGPMPSPSSTCSCRGAAPTWTRRVPGRWPSAAASPTGPDGPRPPRPRRPEARPPRPTARRAVPVRRAWPFGPRGPPAALTEPSEGDGPLHDVADVMTARRMRSPALPAGRRASSSSATDGAARWRGRWGWFGASSAARSGPGPVSSSRRTIAPVGRLRPASPKAAVIVPVHPAIRSPRPRHGHRG